jgi:alpha-L-fucosidase
MNATKALVLTALLLTPLASWAGETNTVTRLQEDFLTWKYGLFLHFNVGTFTDREWANGHEDPTTFAPEKLDCHQWAEVASAAGMKYAVLTVKHTGGWCLWPSAHTRHGVQSFPRFREGKGDVVREFVDAFRARGLKVGFYYCFPGNYAGKYGNVLLPGQPDLHGLPPEADGDYAGFIKKQMTELLTQYGPIDLIWADQYGNSYTGKQWPEIKAHIKALQSNCLVIANNAHSFPTTDIHGYEYPALRGYPGKELPPAGNTNAAEVCDTITPGYWFWNNKSAERPMLHAGDLAAMIEFANNRRANYLLNVPPDKTGRIPERFIVRLKEVAALLGRKAEPK